MWVINMSQQMWMKIRQIVEVRFELYLLLAVIMVVFSLIPRPLTGDEKLPDTFNVSRQEHQRLLSEVDREADQIDVIRSKQIDIYAKVTTLESKVVDLENLAQRREGLLDTMMIGIAVLIIEMAIRGIFKARNMKIVREEE